VVTHRQRQILDFIEGHLARHRFAPSLEEIARHLGVASVATVHKHLRSLEARGAIRRQHGRSRALELARTPAPASAKTLPLLGIVAAGTPLEPIEVRETIDVPTEVVGASANAFVLRVRGDSMVGDGILDGDLVVVEPRREVPAGATVVALVRGEATVKRFYRERGGTVRLEPANERVAPIVAPADEVEIRGVVRGLLRRYRR